MNKFWHWVSASAGEKQERTLHMEGAIAPDSWFDDDVTPQKFKDELMADTGPVTLWINSPGGDVFAAAQIYNMLMEYPGDVTVKIDGLAASAASVIAMAGSKVLMSPVATMMVHNPATIAWGDSAEMRKAMHLLDEVKEGIMNAYEIKTGLARGKLSNLMDAETWMSAKKAVELGFADGILFVGADGADHDERAGGVRDESYAFSRLAVTNSILEKIKARADSHAPEPTPVVEPEDRVRITDLEARLNLLKY